MIKKEYIQPTVKEVEIKLPTILAGSEQEKINEEQEPENALSLDAEFEE